MKRIYVTLALFAWFHGFAQKQFCGEVVYEVNDSLNTSKTFYTVYIAENSALYVKDSADASKVNGFTEMLLKIQGGEAFEYYINKELGVALKKKRSELCQDYSLVSEDRKQNVAVFFVRSKPMISNGGNYIMEFEATYFSNLNYYIFSKAAPVKCYPVFGTIQGNLMQGSLSTITENGIKSYSRTRIKQMKETKLPQSMFELPASLKIEEHTNENELKYFQEYFMRHRKE